MPSKDRLGFLLDYHRNLSIQLISETTPDGKQRLEASLVMLEEEIESVLFNKSDFS